MRYRNTSICLRGRVGCCDASADGTDRRIANKGLTITGSDRPAERLTRGTGRRARRLLGEFCGFSSVAPPPEKDPAHGQAHPTVTGREGGRGRHQGRPRGGHRGRAGRHGPAGAGRGQPVGQDHDGRRASSHRRPGSAQPAGHPHLHRPLGRHAVLHRAALLRQPGGLGLAVPRELLRGPQPQQHLRGRGPEDPGRPARQRRALRAQALQARQDLDHADLLGYQAEWQAQLLRPGGPVGGGRRLARRGVHGRRDR